MNNYSEKAQDNDGVDHHCLVSHGNQQQTQHAVFSRQLGQSDKENDTIPKYLQLVGAVRRLPDKCQSQTNVALIKWQGEALHKKLFCWGCDPTYTDSANEPNLSVVNAANVKRSNLDTFTVAAALWEVCVSCVSYGCIPKISLVNKHGCMKQHWHKNTAS